MTDQQLTDRPTTALVLDDDADVVADAVSVIDDALGRLMQRDLVSSGEVADVLLDLRTLLTSRD